MGRSNTANGGYSYYDLDIQVATTSDASYTLRAVIYLTSLNVSDSANNLYVSGNWSRSGTLALDGAYNAAAVWYQDIVVNRVYGSGVGVSVSALWASVEYWGVTLSASASYTVPARPYYPPSAPGTPSVTAVGPTSVTLAWTAPTYVDGSAIDHYTVVIDDNAGFSSPEVYVTVAGSPYGAVGLVPGRLYCARVTAHNASGPGAWSGTRTFTTLSGGKVRTAGQFVDVPVKIRSGGAWVTPNVKKRSGGVWVQ